MAYATLHLPSSYVTNLFHYHRIRQCFRHIQEIKKKMQFLTNVYHGIHLPNDTPYTQNSFNTYVCLSDPSRSLQDYKRNPKWKSKKWHHYGVVPLYQNCVSMLHFGIWQVDHTHIYSISSVFCKLHFIVYYGRQLRQLTTVPNYGFLGCIPRKHN